MAGSFAAAASRRRSDDDRPPAAAQRRRNCDLGVLTDASAEFLVAAAVSRRRSDDTIWRGAQAIKASGW
jgi:hypothetical protein